MQSSVAKTKTNNDILTLDDIRYAILASDIVTFDNPVGKFIIPSITPMMEHQEIVERQIPTVKMQNMINDDAMGSGSITTTNYLELPVPKHLFYILEIKITTKVTRGGEDNAMMTCTPTPVIIRKEYLKGQKFIIAPDSDENLFILGVVE